MPTLSEKILWQCLKNRSFLNLKFRRQYVIDGFILDLYCQALKLAIEIDGGIHIKQKNYDLQRQNVVEQHGITFFRIKSKEVESNLRSVLNNIENFIKTYQPPRPRR